MNLATQGKTKTTFLVLIALILSGCETTPTVQSGVTATRSFDGLVKVDNTIMDHAWVRPEADLSQYTKLWVMDAGVRYRPAIVVKQGSSIGRNQTEFGLTEEQKRRFREVVTEEFQSELKNIKSFELVNEAGPDTLVLVGGLLDVASFVPPEALGRSEIYLSEVGEATLLIELKDSLSGTVLVRATDRRAAEQTGGVAFESNRVTNWMEVKRLASRWAKLLARRVDELKTMDLTSPDLD